MADDLTNTGAGFEPDSTTEPGAFAARLEKRRQEDLSEHCRVLMRAADEAPQDVMIDVAIPILIDDPALANFNKAMESTQIEPGHDFIQMWPAQNAGSVVRVSFNDLSRMLAYFSTYSEDAIPQPIREVFAGIAHNLKTYPAKAVVEFPADISPEVNNAFLPVSNIVEAKAPHTAEFIGDDKINERTGEKQLFMTTSFEAYQIIQQHRYHEFGHRDPVTTKYVALLEMLERFDVQAFVDGKSAKIAGTHLLDTQTGKPLETGSFVERTDKDDEGPHLTIV